jgi:hypothetical protein
MGKRSVRSWRWYGPALAVVLGTALAGCQAFMKSLHDRLSKWSMLGQEALEDPIKAVGGDGIVFLPDTDPRPLGRRELATAPPEVLVSYYSPVFVQQRVNPQAQRYPYPAEYDTVGEAHLRRENGRLKSYVAGKPKVYAIFKKLPLEGHDHVQLTYTAWYPAHPKMKAFDVQEADVDSCVVRVTLDADNAPVFYETIMACGCFHKVFVPRWLEEAAKKEYGAPEKDKKFCIERTLKSDIDWEVGGVVDEPRDAPRRPVVFLKAGEHKVIGLGSASRLRVPPDAEKHPYTTTSYADLYALKVDGSGEEAAFFDMDSGGKVRGAERKKEKFLLSFAGVDAAGQPRANDQIKMHFDQSTWGDPTIYAKYLRLPRGAL